MHAPPPFNIHSKFFFHLFYEFEELLSIVKCPPTPIFQSHIFNGILMLLFFLEKVEKVAREKKKGYAQAQEYFSMR
jgi:hypothetical protein